MKSKIREEFAKAVHAFPKPENSVEFEYALGFLIDGDDFRPQKAYFLAEMAGVMYDRMRRNGSEDIDSEYLRQITGALLKGAGHA